MSNKLILYKENIFTKISNWFKKIFFGNKKYFIENDEGTDFCDKKERNNFVESIAVKEKEEEKRLKALQIQYDNGEIDEEDISDEDMDKLIEMYEKETEELNADTERRRIHIEQMLKELKIMNKK